MCNAARDIESAAAMQLPDDLWIKILKACGKSMKLRQLYQLCLVCQSWRQMITESPGVVDKLLFRIPFHTSQLRLLEPESRTRLDTLIIASENVAAIPTVYCLQKEANAYTALGMAKFLEVHNLGVHLSNQEWWKDLWMFPALRSLACSITKHFPVQIPADSLRVLANIKCMRICIAGVNDMESARAASKLVRTMSKLTTLQIQAFDLKANAAISLVLKQLPVFEDLRDFIIDSNMPLEMIPSDLFSKMRSLEHICITADCPLPNFDSLKCLSNLTHLEWGAKPQREMLHSLPYFSNLQRVYLRRFDEPECLQELVLLVRKLPQQKFSVS